MIKAAHMDAMSQLGEDSPLASGGLPPNLAMLLS